MCKRIVGLATFSLVATFLFPGLGPVFAGEPPRMEAAPGMLEAKSGETMPAKGSQEKLEGLVGTVVAADSGAHTIVVDVPLEKGVLRVGAWTTAETTFTGVESMEAVEPGSRVRIDIRRVEDGSELIGLDVLDGPKG
jgi:hypothetical protein